MFIKSTAYAIPLASPFNRPSASEPTQYVIQLTIPSSSPDAPSSKRVNGSIVLWAGVGRMKASRREEMNEYERARAEEMEEPLDVQATFEGSRKLGMDFACAIPTTIKGAPVASSTLLNGVEAQDSSTGGRSTRARGMAERLAKRFHVQILLSIDLPPATHLLDSSAGMPGGGVPGMDPLGDKLYLGLERALVRVLDKALA